jgi:hypothetical protein
MKVDILKVQQGVIPDGTISPPMTPKYNNDQNLFHPFDPMPSNSPKKIITDSSSLSPIRKSTPLSPISGFENTANSSMTSHHFTMTPADRRKTVAATRAIRQQIVRFEEAFQKIHGRKPRGPKERAPLLSTYAQYRDWKRAIRSDAACRIQAFFRGSRLSRKYRPTIQPPFIPHVMEEENSSSIEVHPQTPIIHSTREMNIVEAPQDLEMLKMQKRELKDLLKAYDRDWYRRTGRMPVKAEKEPIRNLYEQYNMLKSKIKEVEHRLGGGSQTGEASPTNSDAPMTPQELVIPMMTMSNDVTGKPIAAITPPLVASIIEPSNTMATLDQDNQSVSSDLAQLLNEKQSLHRLLRNYEKEFSRKHGRQVSSFEDIRPVARQYRKYKEIKKAIAARQGANATNLDDRYELHG